MTKQVQRRRGTATQHTSFTGAEGEISVNTTNKTIHVHDGTTTGGFEAARIDLTNVTGATVAGKVTGSTLSSLTITSADINGGTIDSTAIGNTTPSSGIFTTLSASSTLTLGGTAVTSTAAELNYNDITTLGTVQASKTVTANASGDVLFPDGDKAIFGASSDLQIYHDGVNSRIVDTGAGDLMIWGSNVEIATVGGNKYFQGAANVARLYHTNDEKLATTATGISVTGNATFADNGKAIFGAGSDLQIYHDSNNSYIADTGTGGLRLLADADTAIRSADNSTPKAIFGGDVKLYYSGNLKIATTATGIDVTGTVVADGLSVGTIGNLGNSANDLVIYSTEAGHNGLRMHLNGILPTDNTGAIIDADANLGIDTHRFKDLYLSGGVYLGGTGSANYLDEYEEGVWYPSYTSWIADPTVATTAKYTKIGRLVNVSVYLTGGTTQAGSSITGLPFTCGTESSMISTNGSNSSLVFYGTVLGGNTVIGSLSAQTLTGTYYAVTATYMI